MIQPFCRIADGYSERNGFIFSVKAINGKLHQAARKSAMLIVRVGNHKANARMGFIGLDETGSNQTVLIKQH